MAQLKETRVNTPNGLRFHLASVAGASASVDRLIQNAMSGNVPRHSALEYFQYEHPTASATSAQELELVQMIEDQGCNHVSLEALIKGLTFTQGTLHHYLSGMVIANFTVRALMETYVPSQHSNFAATIQSNRATALESICETHFDVLSQSAAEPELANQLAVLECATYALVHANPVSSAVWLNRLSGIETQFI